MQMSVPVVGARGDSGRLCSRRPGRDQAVVRGHRSLRGTQRKRKFRRTISGRRRCRCGVAESCARFTSAATQRVSKFRRDYSLETFRDSTAHDSTVARSCWAVFFVLQPTLSIYILRIGAETALDRLRLQGKSLQVSQAAKTSASISAFS